MRYIHVFSISLFILVMSSSIHAQNGFFSSNSNGTNPTLELEETQDNDYSRIFFTNSGYTNTKRWSLAGRLGSTAEHRFGLYYNGAPRWVYNEETGGMGIGTSTPNAKFEVSGGNSIFSDGITVGSTDIAESFSGLRLADNLDITMHGDLTKAIYFYDASNNLDGIIQYVNNGNFVMETNVANIILDGETGMLLNTDDQTRVFIAQDGRISANTNSTAPRTNTQFYVESDEAYGIRGNNESTSNNTYGVYGHAYGGGTGNRYGTYGVAGNNSGSRYGIYGSAHTSGTYINAFGVYGYANTLFSNSWGVYSNGDFWYTGNQQAPSDARLKKNIRNLDTVLDKVMQLEAKTYQFNTKKYDYVNLAQGDQIGFISQDVQEIFPELVEESNHAFQIENEKNPTEPETKELEILGMNYIGFIPIAIKAIQEQQTQIEALKEANEELEGTNEILMSRLLRIEAMLANTPIENRTEYVLLTNAELKQNTPNPFSENTMISYFIPEKVKNASLQITDDRGEVLKTIVINARGTGQVELQANVLSAGNYSYSLILDGRILETKQMILTR